MHLIGTVVDSPRFIEKLVFRVILMMTEEKHESFQVSLFFICKFVEKHQKFMSETF